MAKKALSSSMHYFDVSVGLVTLAVAIACILTATGQIWPKHPWNYKDWAGLGLFLLNAIAFILFRRQAYAQRTPWILLCFSVSTFAAMVLLFRRWAFVWTGVGSAILLFGLCMRSKTVPERLSREDISAFSLTVGSVLFTLALAEGALRLMPSLLTEVAYLRISRQGTGPWHIPHPYIGHLHIANASSKTARPGVETATADIWGFRNTWPWPEKAEIMVVGDSFAYSQMVDDDHAWTAVLNRLLPHSRVLNLGLIGGAPQQYLRIYETFGIDRAPKVLLVGLLLSNDLWGAKKFDLWWQSGGKGSFPDFGRPEAIPGIRGWIVSIAKNIYLFALLQDLREAYQDGRLFRGRTMNLADGGRIHLGSLARVARYRAGGPEFTLILETLERIWALARQHKTHAVVLFFPSKEEVYLPLVGEEAANLAAPFIPELDKRAMSYIDLGPYFRQQAAKGETLFFEVDGHPNARGYALIAQVVFSHLKENARKYGLKDWVKDSSSPSTISQ